MDKLTAIKIKYDDGTYSDEIPVSVLSENVEWDSTHTLVDVLGSIDIDVTGTIQDQISQLFNEKVSIAQLNNYVASQLNTDVTTWLQNNVTPVGSAVTVDDSLSITESAGDAKVTGDLINSLIGLNTNIYFNQTLINIGSTSTKWFDHIIPPTSESLSFIVPGVSGIDDDIEYYLRIIAYYTDGTSKEVGRATELNTIYTIYQYPGKIVSDYSVVGMRAKSSTTSRKSKWTLVLFSGYTNNDLLLMSKAIPATFSPLDTVLINDRHTNSSQAETVWWNNFISSENTNVYINIYNSNGVIEPVPHIAYVRTTYTDNTTSIIYINELGKVYHIELTRGKTPQRYDLIFYKQPAQSNPSSLLSVSNTWDLIVVNKIQEENSNNEKILKETVFTDEIIDQNKTEIIGPESLEYTVKNARWDTNSYLYFSNINVINKQKIIIGYKSKTIWTGDTSGGTCVFKDSNGTTLSTINLTNIAENMRDELVVPENANIANVTIYGVSNGTGATIGEKGNIIGAYVLIEEPKFKGIYDNITYLNLETLLKNTRLKGKVFGPKSVSYIAKTTNENWQTKSYLKFTEIEVNPLDCLYVGCEAREGLGERNGIVTFYNIDNEVVSNISMNNFGKNFYSNKDGGFLQYISVPYGAVKATVQFEAISNATTAGESSIIGKTYYCKNCYIYIGEKRNSYLNDEWTTAIDTIRQNQGSSICFGIQSDTHFAMQDEEIGRQMNEMSKYIGFDFIANLGDITRGYGGGTFETDSPKGMRLYAKEIMYRYTENLKCPFLVAVGNHEANSIYATEHEVPIFTQDELYAQFIRQVINTSNEIYYIPGKKYYYLDKKHVRIIVIDTNDSSTGAFTISENQLTWLNTKALNTTKPVIVLSHVPLVYFEGKSYNYVPAYANVVSALQTFKNNGGIVLGCLSGHAHEQNSQKVDGIWYIVCTKSDNQQPTTAEFFMIDLNTYIISTIGVGEAESRTFE